MVDMFIAGTVWTTPSGCTAGVWLGKPGYAGLNLAYPLKTDQDVFFAKGRNTIIMKPGKGTRGEPALIYRF